jgi:ABC-type methionine transport system permease subunit
MLQIWQAVWEQLQLALGATLFALIVGVLVYLFVLLLIGNDRYSR